MEKRLQIKEFVVEHQNKPVGIDCEKPRFGWKLCSTQKNVMQSAYRICVYKDGNLEGDTEKVETEESIEVEIPGWRTKPMTEYQVHVTVWDNYGNCESAEATFETGRLGIPFEVKKQIQKARVYVTAHGVYRLYVNGIRPDNREFAPENTSYYHILQYQTYDVTDFLKEGKNVFGIILGDGWWAGRVGVSGDSYQYGDKLGLLLEAVKESFIWKWRFQQIQQQKLYCRDKKSEGLAVEVIVFLFWRQEEKEEKNNGRNEL